MILQLVARLVVVVVVAALISSAPICRAILAAQNSTGDASQDPNSENRVTPLVSQTNNLTVNAGVDSQQLTGGELDTNSTFYYEANAFLLNKQQQQREGGSGNIKQATRHAGHHTLQQPPVGEQRAISGRNGRMLDLDALVGDFAIAKANREARSQLTSRQSRNLAGGGEMIRAAAGGGHQLDIGGGKRLHIQGFIPIVGVKDDTGEEEGEPHVAMQMSNKQQRPKMMMSASQMQPTFSQQPANDLQLPYGQSSIGHATFNVQRYLNTDQTTGESNQHQFVPLPQMQPMQSQLVEAKFNSQNSNGGGGGLVNTLKKPIKKLTNTFGGGANSDNAHAKQQQQQQQLQLQLQPAQNCLCVPFYMCKGGYLSESGLGRAQIQQMIVQQQQQQQLASQQPRQLTVAGNSEQVAGFTNGPSRLGSVESVAAQDRGASYANSMVPVDERSFERDVITAAPVSLELSVAEDGVGLNQTSTLEVTQQQQQQQQQVATKTQEDAQQADTISPAGPSANVSSALANPDEMTTLNQANDYSQDILGRMLGLKTAASQQQASERQQSGGVCGLLRTCCTIPSHLLPYQQQQQQQQLQQLIQQQDQLMQQQQQSALQRYQQPQSFGAVSPMQPQQISRMQTVATPAVSALQQLAALPSSLIHRTSSMIASHQPTQLAQLAAAAPRPINSPQVSMQQYSRASYPQQPLQSFQQQQQQQQQQQALVRQQMVQPPVAATAAATAPAASQVARLQLGTRKLLEGRCGLRQSTGINGRVQNLAYQENAAEFGEYPAQAAILKRLNGSESLFVCGGTLISQSWVATAAHCIRKHLHAGEQLKVRLGEWDVHRDDEFYPFVEKEVRDLVVHPEFVPGNLINDLALLRLDSPVDPTLPHVNPACLPTLDESFARQRCWVTGWGKDSFGQKGSFQAVLQEVELPVQGHAECELQLRQTRLGPHYRLHPGFICAGGEGGRDACEGDGGSGLYCAQEGVIKVAGLVSWGIGCGQAGVPGVYVNVAHYRPWIENIIAIDEDIYSSYNQLPNTLISERSPNGGGGGGPLSALETAGNSTTTTRSQMDASQQVSVVGSGPDEARHASTNSTTTEAAE